MSALVSSAKNAQAPVQPTSRESRLAARSRSACIALTAAFRRRVTDSDDDPPFSGHDNGFAKLHAHDGVAGASKDAATTVVTIGGARCSW